MATNSAEPTTVLFRPVGPKELDLIEKSGFREFPPRLEGQPFFYPVQNEEYAIQIARDWNATNPAIGAGFVTRFKVWTEFIAKFELRKVGGATHLEYWIPAERLAEFNRNIVGKIEVIAQFPPPKSQ
jgi:hypothetical protein